MQVIRAPRCSGSPLYGAGTTAVYMLVALAKAEEIPSLVVRAKEQAATGRRWWREAQGAEQATHLTSAMRMALAEEPATIGCSSRR